MRKNKTLATALILLGLAWLLPGCKNEPETFLGDYKYEYFPLDSGRYITYDVDSIYCYNDDGIKDTAYYQLKYEVGDTFYDNQNELSYEVSIHRRENTSSPWVFYRKWYAKKNVTNAQQVEDDLRFIKLIFPPQQDATWNGNLYIASGNEPFLAYKNWESVYEGVDVPYTINGFSFDSALLVTNVADSIFTYKHLRKEVYVKNLGMVYQEWEMKNKQEAGSWFATKWKGFSLKMRMVEHN